MNKTKKPVKKQQPPKAKTTQSPKRNDSLVPLVVILVILLAAVSFLAFSDKSKALSGIFSRGEETSPTIERPEIIQNNTVKPENSDSFTVTGETAAPVKPEAVPTQEPEAVPAEKAMTSRLFFVKVSDEGQISLKSILRTIAYETTPLTETLKSLIAGPDRTDLNKGLMNLIPQDTVLKSVKISGGVAYLDFNDSFRYNSLGFEGSKAQLMQIVYTATEFESVQSVQILIDGEKYEYLGAEGIYIGAPLNRETFNTF